MLLNRLNELTCVHFEEVLNVGGRFDLSDHMLIKFGAAQTLLRLYYFLNSFITVLKFFFKLIDLVYDGLAQLFFIHVSGSR